MTGPVMGTCLAALVCWGSADGQTADTRPAFEVASVKPAAQAGGADHWGPGTVSLNGESIATLLSRAYGVKRYQIDGPAWLFTQEYDINAKMPSGASREQIPAMLQSLLAERFRLAFHRETKSLPVYGLVVAKGGPKLIGAGSSAPPGWPVHLQSGRVSFVGGPYSASGITGQMRTAELANFLTNNLDRPVLDFTGLKGTYYIDIKWTPDERAPIAQEPAGLDDDGAAEAGAPGTSIFSVLQDTLGLRLETRKAGVEVLVIDHAEKTPTQN
jgi:uncharacterized protein (TIGR03435 family)